MNKEIKSIQVLGSGCPTCKQLLEITKKVVKDLKIKIEVEYITDISKMIELGVMTSPVLAINGKPVLTGGGKTSGEVKEVLCGGEVKKSEEACSCGGNC